MGVEEAPKLVRSRSAIKLKYTKVVAPEPIKLALTKDATELAEPQKPVVEAAKLVRTKSATELTESAKKVEEPAKLVRTKTAIRMRAPTKKVIKLQERDNEFTYKTRKASLSRQVGGTSFFAKKVVKDQLTKGSEDLTVTEKRQRLLAVNEVVSYKQSKRVLSESADEQALEQEQVVVAISNTSRDFARDELVSTENGLDVEEEYDWSYLKWYAGGVATQYLLGGRGSVRHVHHNSKKSGRKE